MEELNPNDVVIHHFNYGHGRGSIRIVHVPTGISVEGDSTTEPTFPLVRRLKDELTKKVLGRD